MNSYFKLYNCVEIKDYNCEIEILTFNHIIADRLLVLDKNT